jgi:hypothetical protein
MENQRSNSLIHMASLYHNEYENRDCEFAESFLSQLNPFNSICKNFNSKRENNKYSFCRFFSLVDQSVHE